MCVSTWLTARVCTMGTFTALSTLNAMVKDAAEDVTKPITLADLQVGGARTLPGLLLSIAVEFGSLEFLK